MGQISLTFPDSTYTSANKPSVETLKSDLAAIETGVNTNQTAAVETTDTDVSSNSWVLDEDAMGSDSDQKVATQQSVKAYVDAAISATKEALFPVGSIYVNYSVSTNPGTLLGFGTWSAITDEVLAGKGSGTFASIGSVGAETKTIAASNLPQLAVTVTDPGHLHGCPSDGGDQSSTSSNFRRESQNIGDINTKSANTGITATANTGGANTAISLVQPTRVVYMWRRSA